MEKEKLIRCGACGAWLNADPSLYTEEEQNNAELDYCNNCGTEENLRNNSQYEE